MALALESAVTLATARAIGEWVERSGGEALRRHTERLRRIDMDAAPSPKRAEAPTQKGALPPREFTVRMSTDASDDFPNDELAGDGLASDDLASVARDRDQHQPERNRSRRVSLGVAAWRSSAAGGALAFGARDGRVSTQASEEVRPGNEATPVDSATLPQDPPASPVRVAPDPLPSPSAAPRGLTPSVPRSPRLAPKAAASSSACDPPYHFVKGIKRFKPECI